MRGERQLGVAVVINNDIPPLLGHAAKAAHFNRKSADVPGYYLRRYIMYIIMHAGHLNRPVPAILLSVTAPRSKKPSRFEQY